VPFSHSSVSQLLLSKAMVDILPPLLPLRLLLPAGEVKLLGALCVTFASPRIADQVLWSNWQLSRNRGYRGLSWPPRIRLTLAA